MNPLLDDLNESQREAVTHGTGPLMVLAGAGSGKTRVITRRIAYLLDQGAGPESILAVTFTNKAAGEMARRVQEMGGVRLQISTFHSACARFLRAHAPVLGFPRNFSIFDTYDRDSCIKMLMAELGLGIEGVKPSHVGNMISRLKNHGTTPEEFQEAYPCDTPLTLDELTALVYGPYQERLMKLGAMDFDDLLTRFLDLMQKHPEVADGYRERFEWVLVDEFQDTNRVQYDLTREIAAGYRNLCVVGDPDQSIYRFRGAEVQNILDFQKDYPDVQTVRLETNYRSTRRILRAAQGVILNNSQRLDRGLDSNNEEGDLVSYRVFSNSYEENDAACRGVLELISDRVSPDEIAVFYRSHFLSRGLEEVLRRAGVPYEVVGGLSFFERREIKDLLSYLRPIVNPLDDVSLDRIINVPPRRIGKKTLDKIQRMAAAEQISLFEFVMEEELHHELPSGARQGLLGLRAVFEQARDVAEESAAAAVRVILEGTSYVEHACNLGDPQDVAREENIGELVNDAADFDSRFGGGLAAYLNHVALLTSEDRRAATGPTVSLMTIHAAKGLEFDHVFLVGLEEGLLPSSRAESNLDIEEERRLMYVALTRARKTLTLSGCDRRMVQGFENDQQPSRFVSEIPNDCVESSRRVQSDWSGWDDSDAFGRDEFAHEPMVDEFAQLDPEDHPQLQPDTRVLHRVYGTGVVVRVSGTGIQARAVVRFDDGRERTLLLEYGELTVMPGSDEW